MKLRLPYMGKIAGLALIQSTVSAVGLLLTCIIWNKWQSCHIRNGREYVIFRMGLWDKCVDRHLIRASECSPISHETVEMKCITVLMLLSISLQSMAVIMGLIIRRYERQQNVIFVPILFNVGSGICGTVGLIMYASMYNKKTCHLSASFFVGCVGVVEVYASCFLFMLVAIGK